MDTTASRCITNKNSNNTSAYKLNICTGIQMKMIFQLWLPGKVILFC